MQAIRHVVQVGGRVVGQVVQVGSRVVGQAGRSVPVASPLTPSPVETQGSGSVRKRKRAAEGGGGDDLEEAGGCELGIGGRVVVEAGKGFGFVL